MTRPKAIVSSVLFLFFLGAIVTILFRDRHPAALAESDLVPLLPETGKGSNGWSFLSQAVGSLQWPSELNTRTSHFASDDTWDQVRVEQLLGDNRQALDLIERALTLIPIQGPTPRSFEDDYGYLESWRSLANLASIHAAHLFRTGRESEGFDAAINIVRLAHQLQDSGGASIQFLTAGSIKEIGLNRVRWMTARTRLSPNELLNYLQALAPYEPNTAGLSNAIKIEFHLALHTLQDIAAGRSPGTNSPPPTTTGSLRSKAVLNVPKTRSRLASDARRTLVNVPRPLAEASLSSRSRPARSFSTFRSLISGNLLGEQFVDMLSPAWDNLIARKCRENVSLRATRLLLALKCYYSQHGALPSALDDLVPQFFTEVPRDDYDGLPFRYRRAERIVYSVGPDLIDSGGREFDISNRKLDLPFAVDF